MLFCDRCSVRDARNRRWIRFSICDGAWFISTAVISLSVIVQIGLKSMQMRAITYAITREKQLGGVSTQTYRVSIKSLNHLFSRYLQSPWEHRKNNTAKLKLRLWSLCGWMGGWKKSIRLTITFWHQNEEIVRFFTFSDIFWREEIKILVLTSIGTKPAWHLWTVTLSLINSPKHIDTFARAYSAFLWYVFELIALI
jgi:hypothetical protein